MRSNGWLKTSFAPGTRILVRDAEWLIRRVDVTSTGGQVLRVVGISELVRDKEAIFLTEIDNQIEVLDPAKTRLVQDKSSGYRSSILYLESLFRQTPPTDERIHVGHRAAMDAVPYQLDNRMRQLEKQDNPDLLADIEALRNLHEAVQRITPDHFSKYQRLVRVIRDELRWTGRDPADRLVVFTERIETLKFLEQVLPRDLKLKPDQVRILHGSMADVDQQAVVEAFGKDEESVRLLIASDVASEGINLHYLSHRMIHFDIPWSLMVFQQRNGRIDRYGQEHTPQIVYLTTESTNDKIRGDQRILELLIQKDEQAMKNIGDPAAFMGVYDIGEEERCTAKAIESGMTPAVFEAQFCKDAVQPLDVLAMIMGDVPTPKGESATSCTASMPSLFTDDHAYLQAALHHLGETRPLQTRIDASAKMVEFTAPRELEHRFRFLPREIKYGLRGSYLTAFEDAAGTQNFLNAQQNYPLLKGSQSNLYKCFLPQAWMIGRESGVSGFLHPEGIYDDPKGGTFRVAAYTQLRAHFQFQNELILFSDVDHHAKFSINIYGQRQDILFSNLANLYAPQTVGVSFNHDGRGPVPGIKDEQNKWNVQGHARRIVHVTEKELALFAKLYDEVGTPPIQARLPALHSQELMGVLEKFAAQPRRLGDLEGKYFSTVMWDETNAVKKDHTIRRETRFPDTPSEWILSGPHFNVGTPYISCGEES